jgi:L-fuconolactonase
MTATSPNPLSVTLGRVDAHQHFWNYSEQEFEWIDDTMQEIRRDFLPADLAPQLRASGVEATIAVQARQSLAETDWLLELAASTPWIAGVVGWLPLASPTFHALLDRYIGQPKLRGVRHVLQAEPDAFFEDEAFHRGMRLLQSTGPATGLVYDLLIVERQMKQALRFVDRHPDQVIVLDHMAKPRIAAGELQPWATHLRALGLRKHVSCKLSGLVTEADADRWTVEELRPFVEVALEAFGPSRLLFGSDWPVCTVAASYARWCEAVEDLLRNCTGAEREAILGGNAQRVYRLV